MKKYKLDILAAMEWLAYANHSISIKTAAEQLGIYHLKTQDVFEIAQLFIKRNPEYKIYRLVDNPYNSAFQSILVSDNETPPIK